MFIFKIFNLIIIIFYGLYDLYSVLYKIIFSIIGGLRPPMPPLEGKSAPSGPRDQSLKPALRAGGANLKPPNITNPPGGRHPNLITYLLMKYYI